MEGVATRGFGALLRRYRVERELTQEELAERAGLSVRGISDLERGVNRAPYQATTERLIAALALSPEEAGALRQAGSRRRRPVVRGAARPVALTSFVGRERELAQARELMSTSRLVTFIGVGGSGKTRLALELVARMETEWRGRIALVELAPLADPGSVAPAFAQAVGLVGGGGTRSDIEAALVVTLKETEMLLIVDNCEHVIDRCAVLVERLLRGCPGLRILATSREPLEIPGEVTFTVPPLAIPFLDRVATTRDLSRCESVRLFVDRAAAARAGFALDDTNAAAVARICHRLDGLPLAIELAASRTRSTSLGDMIQRLDDRFSLLSRGERTAAPRHQTLRATIDWSYQLLSEQERILLRRLAVFAGGWTLEDAESVCADAQLPREAIMDVHARVSDRSLIVADASAAGPGRYRLLETIRQYAAERLAEAGEVDRMRRQHFVHFLDMAEEYHSAALTRGSDSAVFALAAHRDNFRAALAWGAEADPEATLRLASALDDFWRLISAAEGWSWLRRALRGVPDGNPHRLRALLTAGMLAAYVSEYADGTSLLREAVAIAQPAGDRASEGWANLWLGRLAVLREDAAGAEANLTAALAIREVLDSPLGRVRILALLFLLRAVILQHSAEGEQQLQDAADHAQEIGDTWGAGFAHMVLSMSAADTGDIERAHLHGVTALHAPSLGPLLGIVLQQLGRAMAEDDPARALRLLGGAAGHLERTGTVPPAFLRRRADDARERAAQLLGAQTAVQTFEEGRRMSLDDAIALAGPPLEVNP